MSTTQRNKVMQYILLAGLTLVLFFTDLGTSVLGGVQQLLLKTGIKDAPTSGPAQVRKEQQNTENYPHKLTLNTLDGQVVQLSDLKGKVVFLNQWATWCPPCRAEMPAIEKLYQLMDKNKVAFVMLSLDEDPQKARQFVAQKKFSFPVYVPGGQLPEEFYSQSIPTTIILDSDGQIAQRIEGMANYDTEEFRQYLLSLFKPVR